MADGHEGDKGIRKLREAADLLSGALSPSTDSLDSPSSPNASINSSRSERAVANLRTLFGPYADLPGSCRKPATQTDRAQVRLLHHQEKKESTYQCFLSLVKPGHMILRAFLIINKL